MVAPVTITINDNGDITSVNWQEFLLQELELPITRDDIAKTYSYILLTNAARNYDIAAINGAIIKKWSKAALVYIKTKAWKLAEYERSSQRRSKCQQAD